MSCVVSVIMLICHLLTSLHVFGVHGSIKNNRCEAFGELREHILGESYLFDKRFLPSNIGLLLRKLRVVVCFHRRRLMICKHGLFTANR